MDELDSAIEKTTSENNASSKYDFNKVLSDIESEKIAQEKLKYKEFNSTSTYEHEQNNNNKELINGIGILIIGILALYFAFILVKKLFNYLLKQSHQIRLIFFISTLWIILIPALAIFINEYDRYGFDEPHVVIFLTLSLPIYIFISYFLSKKLMISFKK